MLEMPERERSLLPPLPLVLVLLSMSFPRRPSCLTLPSFLVPHQQSIESRQLGVLATGSLGVPSIVAESSSSVASLESL